MTIDDAGNGAGDQTRLGLPAKIGRYVIEGVVGQGAMGLVYRGHDPQIDRNVEIKTIRTDLLADDMKDEVLTRFSREARAAGRFVHPSIVAVFDFDGAHDPPYIAMELVEGRSLAELRQAGFHFALPQIRSIMLQILSALDCAHRHGVVHRDIKPSNVLIAPDNQVKVADFGVARFSTPDMTQFGGMVGTPLYMAPEQLQGRVEDHRADIFAAGVILYELLTSKRPHVGRTPADILAAILTKQRVDPVAHVPTLPPAIRDVLDVALAAAPGQRYQTAAAFRQAIEGALVEMLAPEQQSASETMIEATRLLSEMPETPPMTTDNPAVYRHIERDLAKVMGPIASMMLKRAVRETSDPDEIYARLADDIPDAGGAKAFQALAGQWRERLGREQGGGKPGSRAGATLAGTGTVAPSTWPGTEDRFAAADLDAAKQALATHCGPIATVLVRNAARQARSLPELYEALAAHIDEPASRTAFLRRMSRL